MTNELTIIQPGDINSNNPVLLSALTTARALLQRRLCAWDDHEHDRAVRNLDAFMSHLQAAEPALADRVRCALYEDVTGRTMQEIADEIMPELAEVE